MAIEVFNRYELKYLLDMDTFNSIVSALEKRMIPDPHNGTAADGYEYYNICNIYYDTSDDYIIRRSLEHPVYKEKLRMRCYGIPSMGDEVFLEIKKKFKGIVNKRRTLIGIADAYRLTESLGTADVSGENINIQALMEIRSFLKRYEPVPKVCISYERLAFFDREDPEIRVSFDRSICARRHDLRLESGCYGRLLLPPELRLMEIKLERPAPIWLAQLLSSLRIYKISFSKYGIEYMLHNAEKAGRLKYAEKLLPGPMRGSYIYRENSIKEQHYGKYFKHSS